MYEYITRIIEEDDKNFNMYKCWRNYYLYVYKREIIILIIIIKKTCNILVWHVIFLRL